MALASFSARSFFLIAACSFSACAAAFLAATYRFARIDHLIDFVIIEMERPAVSFDDFCALSACFSSRSSSAFFSASRALASSAALACSFRNSASSLFTAALCSSLASAKHRLRCSPLNLRNAESSFVDSPRWSAAAIASSDVNPDDANGIIAFRSHGRSCSFMNVARAFILAYIDCGPAPVIPGVAAFSSPSSLALCALASLMDASCSSAQEGTRSFAFRSAARAYGRQIMRACTSVSSEMSIPRINATTRISMKSSSGMVSMRTTRISGGMFESSGETCASIMSMRVSNKM